MIIHAENLTKHFGKMKALDDVSFTVEAGEAVALSGANGAGKTTVLRCLLGVIGFSGQVTVAGLDVKRQGKAVRAAIGYVPQEAAMHNLPAREALTLYARLKKTPQGRIDIVLDQVGLAAHATKRVSALSGGMKRRLALAVALLSDPPILLLDEPTANLDAQARHDFLHLIHTLNQAGKTIVFSSHRFSEVITLATRVLLLEDGRLTRTATPHEHVLNVPAQQWLRVQIAPRLHEQAAGLLAVEGFSAAPNGQALNVEVGTVSKMVPLRILEAAQIEVNDFDVVANTRVSPEEKADD